MILHLVAPSLDSELCVENIRRQLSAHIREKLVI